MFDTLFCYKMHDAAAADDDDDDDDDASFMLCFRGDYVVLLQPTEFEHEIINRTLGQLNTVVKHRLPLSSLLTTSEAAWYLILVLSVCQTITSENLNVRSSYLHS